MRDEANPIADLFHCRKNDDEDGEEKLKGIAESESNEIEEKRCLTEVWMGWYTVNGNHYGDAMKVIFGVKFKQLGFASYSVEMIV